MEIVTPDLLCQLSGYCGENKYSAQASARYTADGQLVGASAVCDKCRGFFGKYGIFCDVIGICDRPAGGNTWCTMCEMIFRLLKSDVNDGHITGAVLATARRICDLFPEPLRTNQCIDRVEFVEGISQIMVSKLFTPNYICSKAGICEKQDKQIDNDNVQHF